MLVSKYGLKYRSQWHPGLDPSVLLWWDPNVLEAGVVTSWTERIAGKHATGTATASRTSMNGMPGVTGGWMMVNVGSILNGKSSLTVVTAITDAETIGLIPFAYIGIPYASGDGSFGMDLRTGAEVRAMVRGTTSWTGKYVSDNMSTPAVWTFFFDASTTGGGAIPGIRKNGAEQVLTTESAASVAGTFGSGNMSLFANTSGGGQWDGPLGHFVIADGLLSGKQLENLERFVGRMAGITL